CAKYGDGGNYFDCW
nr:immunoglobulin heavy chain junction region [Macaca mulatta]MOW92461.1 immunoglobulin heavy chain junction region [Macaca mulatta]